MPMSLNARRFLFAALPTLFLFGGLEFGLRLIHYEGTSIADLESAEGIPDNMYLHRRDRILGPWFVQDPEYPSLKRSNPWRVGRGFHNQKISTTADDRKRLFALGGSTTYGTPYEHEKRGFPEATQDVLNTAQPDEWEIINMGVAGMDASGFSTILTEIAELDPSGIILYTGNNEIRGALLESCTNPYREGLQRKLMALRSIRLLQDQYRRFKKISIQASTLKRQQSDCMQRALRESFAQAPHKTDFPLRDDPLYWRAHERFVDGLERSIQQAEDMDVPLFLVIPAIHLLSSPEGARPNPRLNADQKTQFETALQTAQKSDKLADWQQAYALDPTHALVNYQIGLHLINQSEIIAARTHLEAAVERDYLSKKITPTFQRALKKRCAQESNLYCIDMAEVFEAHSPHGIAGSELFVDFCHPNKSQGIPLIAEQLGQAILQSPLGSQQ